MLIVILGQGFAELSASPHGLFALARILLEAGVVELEESRPGGLGPWKSDKDAGDD